MIRGIEMADLTSNPTSVERELLDGRIAVVTGASRGIGVAIAQRLAQAGASVAVTARTVHEGDHQLGGSISGTADSIVERGGTAVAIAADLARPEERERLVSEVERRLGPIDILVNNAAVTYFEPVVDFDARHFRLMFDVQVRAPFELAQLVLPGMRSRGQGWILNISSRAALHPDTPRSGLVMGGTVYGMCKAALERFSTGLAAEVSSDGIAVNALSPDGLVPTPGVVHHGLDRMVPAEFTEPVEVMAEAAYLLCTGDPSKLTGRIAYSKAIVAELQTAG
jgi:NAD(P)-dependent dehydrogenase (short-subunit alcohol dehydrogenase family)